MSARVRSDSRRTNRRGGHGFILALAMGTSLAVLAATLALVLRRRARAPLSRRNALPGRGSVLRSGGGRAFRGTLQPAGRGTHARYLLVGTAARGGGGHHGAVSARLAGRLAAALRRDRSADRE